MHGSSVIKLVVVLLFGISFMLMSGYALCFFIIGLLPAFMVTFMDKRKERCASNTVSAFNFIGILPYLFDLWESPNMGDLARKMLSDVYVWFFIYGSASLGWLMIWAMPQLVSVLLEARATARIRTIRSRQEKLIAEWGEDIKKSRRSRLQ